MRELTRQAQCLLEAAKQAAKNAYAPYSGFRVGAVLMANGRLYRGCNLENASYSMTVCAERAALARAVSDGVRQFSAIAVAGGKEDLDAPCMPCGACLQALAEFCPPEFPVILTDGIHTLGELLPNAFSLREA